jgi:hypothetical protein
LLRPKLVESALMFTVYIPDALPSELPSADITVTIPRTKQSAKQRARDVQAIIDKARQGAQDGNPIGSVNLKREQPVEGKKRKETLDSADGFGGSEPRAKRTVTLLQTYVEVPSESGNGTTERGEPPPGPPVRVKMEPPAPLRRSPRTPVQPTRSYSTRICYMPPAARGTYYHLATCLSRPALGNYANIEYAHALMMKPAWCSCNDAELDGV